MNPQQTIHYVIGDIHGEAEKLSKLLAAIESRHHWKHPNAAGKLVFLGDYIDRGPNSRQAIEIALQGIEGFSAHYLKGNHEQMMSLCLHSTRREIWNSWMSAGGEKTLHSFGYDVFEHRYDPARLAEAVGKPILRWLDQLELIYQSSDFVCVHAGLNPQKNLQDQQEGDLLWIRRPFLESDCDFGFGVIHGHTPTQSPIVKLNRIGIDTGAGQGGALTALVVDRPWQELLQDPVFIAVD